MMLCYVSTLLLLRTPKSTKDHVSSIKYHNMRIATIASHELRTLE